MHWKWGNKVKQEDFEKKDGEWLSRRVILMLIFSISLGVIAALYPYLPSVNPRNRNVGVDFSDYVNATEMIESDFSQVFNILGGSRPLIYITLHGFQRLFGLEAITTIRYFPVLLNPLLVVSIFILALEIFNDGWIASWAAFFTVSGIQISVGMFSYFLTNMLALSIIFISLGFLFRALRRVCYFNLIFASLIGVFLFSLGFSEIVESKLFHGYGGMSASYLAIENIVSLSRFWYNTVFFFRRIYCGLEANIILFGLSLIALLFLKKSRISEVFLFSFLAVSSFPFLFVDAMIKSRLIYNIPIGLYAAYSFTWLIERKNKDIKLSSYFFVLSSMIVYFFRSMANLI